MAGIILANYQLEAIDRMKNGCILCGSVGSGKSRTSLAYYYKLMGGELNTKNYKPLPRAPCDLYIITTALKRDTHEWEEEMIPFMLSPNENMYGNTVVIDSWNNIKKYTDVRDAFFIFDEQRVVGSGVWVRSFLSITKKNRWILLTATPGDSWKDYIPVFIANGFYRNRSEFYREHIVLRYGKQPYPIIDRYINTGRLLRLRKNILIQMKNQRDVRYHRYDIYADYDKREFWNIIKTKMNPETGEPFKTASEIGIALRKVVNKDESRILKLLELVEDHPRIILFYNFDYELDILRNLYYGEDFVVAEWNGHKHQEVPSGDKWVYLVQYNAGAEGWNCIRTDTIIFYSLNHSYKIMTQAAGRIDRMNTPYKDLYYYYLQSKSPIDIRIRKCLNDKKDFNARAFMDDLEKGYKLAPDIMQNSRRTSIQ